MVKTSVNGPVSIQDAEAEISVAGTLLSPQELEVQGPGEPVKWPV